MLRALAAFCFIGLCAFLSTDEKTPVAWSDWKLPCLTDDSMVDLGQQSSRYVVLHFLLKTECPYCLKYTRDYAKLAESDKNVVHIFLKPDSEDEIRQWMDHLDPELKKELPRICRDVNAKLADAMKIPDGYRFHGQSVHYPALIVLGPDRTEVFRHVGKSNADRCSVETYQAQMKKLKEK